MPYTINKSNGDALVTLADGTTDSTYSVTFVGKNYSNYGVEHNENFLHLMENFSNSTQPSTPVTGQLWWDSALKSLKIYYDGAWRSIPIVAQLTGTTNQITVTNTSGSNVVLSLPQNINTTANPVFSTLALGVANGTPPLTVTSATKVANLNADLLDNQDGTYYLDYPNFTNAPSLGTISSQNANAVNITGGTITGLSSPLSIASGGTGGNTPAAARTALGLTDLSISALPLEVAYGGTGADNGPGARTNLGLGSISTQNSSNVSITGGSITGLSNLSVTSGTPVVPTAAVTVDNTQIATTAFVHDILPKGVILMWYGSIASIPTGWALCNGQTVSGVTTPDLRNRFIIGADIDDSGAKTSVTGSNTQTGGTKDAVVVSHTHTGTTAGQSANHTHAAVSTVSDSGHSHRLPIDVFGNTDTQSLYGTNNADEGIAGDVRTEASTTGITVSTTIGNNSVDHNHTFTTNASGVSGTNQNLPPYYALAYIMKVTG